MVKESSKEELKRMELFLKKFKETNGKGIGLTDIVELETKISDYKDFPIKRKPITMPRIKDEAPQEEMVQAKSLQ